MQRFERISIIAKMLAEIALPIQRCAIMVIVRPALLEIRPRWIS